MPFLNPHTSDPDQGEAGTATLHHGLRQSKLLREQHRRSQPSLRAEEPAAIASVIAQESIASRESGALRSTALAAAGLVAFAGVITLAKMIGMRFFG